MVFPFVQKKKNYVFIDVKITIYSKIYVNGHPKGLPKNDRFSPVFYYLRIGMML